MYAMLRLQPNLTPFPPLILASILQTSGASAFADKSGWPFGPVKDTDDVVDLLKKVDRPYPIRQTDLTVLDYSLEKSVKAFIIVPAQVCRFNRCRQGEIRY
jgi:hypothetical protein